MVKRKISAQEFDVLIIVASTGGPVAIQEILLKVSKNFAIPILIVQHMPANFTPGFAERLNNLCEIEVKEASQGDCLSPGMALVAPGGMQLVIDCSRGQKGIVQLTRQSTNEIYSPCADITLLSIAQHYKHKALAIILTGMGADGCEGAKALHKVGSSIWAQNEASSVIYGMPRVVAEAGITSEVYSLTELGDVFKKLYR